jgi:hypothetical protein
VNCCVAATATEAVVGDMAIDTSVGGVTVTDSVVEPVTPALVAEIVAVPAPTPVARPVPEIVAVVVVSETQVAVPERSFVDWSL